MAISPHDWDAAPKQSEQNYARCRKCLMTVSQLDYRNRNYASECLGAPAKSSSKPKASNDEIMSITHEIAGRARRSI